MSLSAAVLDALLANGASAEMIVAAVKADGAEEEARREAKREGNRVRQARFKAARKAEDNAGNALPSVTERDDALPPLSPNKNPPDPQKLTPNPTGVVSTRARKDRIFVCPEGVDPQHWEDLLANRKTKRLTNTPTAYRQLLDDLAKFADDEWPPGRIVEFAAARGWGAIFDPRNSHGATANGRSAQPLGRHQPADGLSATTRAANRVFDQPFVAGQQH